MPDLEPGVSITTWGNLACDHAQTAARWRIRSNGIGVYVLQCCVCGCELRSLRKSAPEVIALKERCAFDEALGDAWYKRCEQFREIRGAALQRDMDRQQAETRAFYESHLRSDKWQAIRKRVLDRASGMCEGCGIRRADHIHHLTYAHLGDEFLFELVAVCYACHCRIHERELGV